MVILGIISTLAILWGVYGAVTAAWEITIWVVMGIVGLPICMFFDWKWNREWKAAHPDNNLWNLPRGNAIGFNKNGGLIIPDDDDTKEAPRVPYL